MLQKRQRTNDRLKLFDVVELLSDASVPAAGPWGGAVSAGTLGTIVEELSGDFYLVEFDDDGQAEPVIMTLPGSALALNLATPA